MFPLTPLERRNLWKWGLLGIWRSRRREAKRQLKLKPPEGDHESLKVIATFYQEEARSDGVDMSRAEAMAMAVKYSFWCEGRLIPSLQPHEVIKRMGKVRDI